MVDNPFSFSIKEEIGEHHVLKTVFLKKIHLLAKRDHIFRLFLSSPLFKRDLPILNCFDPFFPSVVFLIKILKYLISPPQFFSPLFPLINHVSLFYQPLKMFSSATPPF